MNPCPGPLNLEPTAKIILILLHTIAGPYTGGVRGGSDEPPFFGQHILDIIYIQDSNLHASLKPASNSAAFQITHTGYAIDMHALSHNVIVFACQCLSKNCY